MPGSGVTTIDFGVFPGGSDATVIITGESGIVAGSRVGAWIEPRATADHTADEHMLETIRVFASGDSIVPGVGFTIRAFNINQLAEHEPGQFLEGQGQNVAGSPRQAGQHQATYSEGRLPRIYGVWTVAWAWV